MQQRTKRIWIVLAGALAVLLVAAAMVAFTWWRGGLPQREGVAAIPGLSGAVSVRWDVRGVPYVEAASGEDLAAALGWLHANDRLAQMELGRRAAAGRLAEIAGPRAVPLDRESRTLRFGETADRLWEHAGPESRAWLTAYARGVNAWLEQRGDDLPPDLRLLAGRSFRPEPWQPRDSLAFVLLMARDLSFWNDRPEEEHLEWLHALGVERTADLAPVPPHVPDALRSRAGEGGGDGSPSPGGDPDAGGGELPFGGAAPGPGPGTGSDPGGGTGSASDPAPGSISGYGVAPASGSVRAPVSAPADSSPGSNNWAAGPSRTAGTAPVLANDPHLPFRLPGTWYQARLEAPDYDVAGFSIPGVPGVVIGRNRDLAWALTNVMLDDHDLFLEQVEETPEGPRVRRPGGWLPVEVEEQVIPVAGAEPVTLELRRTDLGPLLPPDPERGLPARSLAWTLYEPGDPLAAFLALGRAAVLEAVPEGIAGYVGPAQNLVVAHRDGGLLWTVLGRIPERRRGDGWLPVPAWEAGYGWDGLRPREDTPLVLRPDADFLVTANNDLLGGDLLGGDLLSGDLLGGDAPVAGDPPPTGDAARTGAGPRPGRAQDGSPAGETPGVGVPSPGGTPASGGGTGGGAGSPGRAGVVGTSRAFAPMPSAYDTSHRARRIRQVLEGRNDWTPAAMAELQTDVVDLYALEVVAASLGGLERGDGGAPVGERDAPRGAALLLEWDGRMAVEPGPSSSAAALFALFERELRRGVFGDEATAHGLSRFDDRAMLVRALAGEMAPAWFDDLSTPEVEERGAVVRAALARAVAAAEARWGEDPAAWSYGDLHTLLQPHPLGGLPVVGGWFQGPRRPAPGSATTVAAFGARWTGDGDLRVTYGPSMRWSTALADPDRSLAVLPSGQAGHPADPHYDDQVEDYLAGVVHPFPWSAGAVEEAAVSRLRLEPADRPPAVPTP